LQNLDTTFKYRVFQSAEHEIVSMEWGGTGSSTIGAEPFNTSMPTL
jgi:hypothetical protein